MDERPHYSMIIEWSDADSAYLVTLPEWEGRVFNPITHGDTYQEAVTRGQEVLALLLTTVREEGIAPPSPRVFAATTV